MTSDAAPGADLHAAGSALALRGCWAEAAGLFRRAVAQDPNDPAKRHALAVALLGAGDYREGFSLYARRGEVERLKIHRPALPCPEWRGEPLAGKHILLFPEQGLGDQIQFARYAPALKLMGADVTLFCAPPLQRLFEPLGVRVIAAAGAVEFPDPDYWSLVGDLPGRLGVTLETVDGRPYLEAPAVAASQAVSQAGAGRIGLVRRGNPIHPNDANRSLPADLILPFEGLSLDPADTGAKDLRDTAEILQGLDAVVSVDTSVVHLAGALGLPCLVLLPAIGCDWRWLSGRSDSPWYASLRLVRQTEPGDWTGPLQAARRWLAERPW
jgi:hypothetical protein